MTNVDLVIFDCDGVLVDSEIVAARVEADLITAAGFPFEAGELAATYAGLTFRDILLRIEEKSSIPFQASLIDQAEALVDRRLATEARASNRSAAPKLPRLDCCNPWLAKASAVEEGSAASRPTRFSKNSADSAKRPPLFRA